MLLKIKIVTLYLDSVRETNTNKIILLIILKSNNFETRLWYILCSFIELFAYRRTPFLSLILFFAFQKYSECLYNCKDHKPVKTCSIIYYLSVPLHFMSCRNIVTGLTYLMRYLVRIIDVYFSYKYSLLLVIWCYYVNSNFLI